MTKSLLDRVASGSINNYKELEFLEEAKLIQLEHIPRGIKTSRIRKNGKTITKIITMGAAGELTQIDALRVREMTDPYNFSIRTWFTNSAYQDPTLSPALQKRNNSFFSTGFELKLELKSMLDGTGNALTPETKDAEIEKYMSEYAANLAKLMEWCESPDVNLIQIMKRAHLSTIIQGRSLILIIGGTTALGKDNLPIALRLITWQDTGSVIIDTLLWKIIGVRMFFANKSVAAPEEMIYITGKNWGLRRDSDYYGASELEAFIQLSRINKKVLNYDLAKASEVAYITKLILTVLTGGDQDTRSTQITNLVNQVIAQGTDVIGVESGVTVTPVGVTADSALLEMIIKVLDDRLISAAGSTRAQMGRTEGLNRDTATIMEVENIRNIRTPDEEMIKTPVENQLLNVLFAHLIGKDAKEIPVKVVMVRKELEDEIEDTIYNNKEDEIDETSRGGEVMDDEVGDNTTGEKPDPKMKENMKDKTMGASKINLHKIIPGTKTTPFYLIKKLLSLPKEKRDEVLQEIEKKSLVR